MNTLKTDKSDTILEKLATQNCSYSGFSYHTVNRYLNAYDPNYKLKHCFVCIVYVHNHPVINIVHSV